MFRKFFSPPGTFCGLLVATLSLSAIANSLAASRTWDGGGAGDVNWQTGLNWDLNTAPVAEDSLVFAGSTSLTNTNDFAAGTKFNGLTFNGAAGAFVLNGNIITLGGDIVNSVASAKTINLSMILNETRTISTASSGTLNIGAGANTTLGGSGGLTKAGLGTVVMYGGLNANYVGNNYSGDLTINTGTVQLQSGITALAWSTTGKLTVNTGTTLTSNGGDASFGGLSGAGTVTPGNRRFAINSTSEVADSFTGNITTSSNFQGAFQKYGSGTLDLTNANVSLTISLSNYGGTLLTKGNAGGGNVLVSGGLVKILGTSGTVLGTQTLASSGNTTAAGTLPIGSPYYNQNIGTNLSGGTVWIAPTGSAQDVVVTSASTATGSTPNNYFRTSGGARLLLDSGSNNSVTLAVGNSANNTSGGMTVSAGGFIIGATHGLGALGVTEKFVMVGDTAQSAFVATNVNGSGTTGLGALPVQTNGVVDTRIIGQDARSVAGGGDGLMTGTFLTYSGTGLVSDAGFTPYNWSTGSTANKNFVGGTTATTVEWVDAPSSASGNSVFALRNDSVITNTGTLAIGTGSTTVAGSLILNGGTINGGTVQVGSTSSNGIGSIYTSLAGGTISSTLAGYDVGIMGPGILKYTGGNTTIRPVISSGATYDIADATGTTNGVVNLLGGVLQSKGTLSKTLSSASLYFGSQGGGFSARGGALNVALNGASSTLVWANGSASESGNARTPNFMVDGSELIFGSANTDNVVTLQNNIDLGGNALNSSRVIRVIDNPGSTADKAVLSGNITGRSANNGINKAGDGTLLLSGANKFEGDVIIGAGTLQAGSSTALSYGTNTTTVQTGSTLDLNGQTLVNGKKIVLNGTGSGGNGALVNNSGTDAVLGDGITLSVVSQSGTWTSVPTINITGGNGTGASASVDGLMMSALTLVSGGSGYTSIPTVSISGQTSGNAATASVTTSSNVVNNPTLNAGADTLFTSVPVVTVTGVGSGATITSSLILNTAGISLTAGSGYTTAPTVTVTGGGGSAIVKADVGSVQLASTSTVGGSGNLTVKPVVSGVGGLTKIGAGKLTLSAANTYTGATVVSAGTLIVDGSIASSSGVAVNSGAILGGHGSVGAISGAGVVGPGNSPGIMTATSVNATAGLDFAFEFTLANTSPIYNNAAASGNDVLHLTSGTPFTASLASGNTVTMYLNVASLSEGDTFKGGFYVDGGNFLSSVSGASYIFYVKDAGGSVTYEGQTYSLFNGAASGQALTVGTVADTADFGSGNVNGYALNVTVVPEPSTWALFGLGAGALFMVRRRARRNA